MAIGPVDFTLHLLSFVAPAWVVGLLVAGAARLGLRGHPAPWWRAAAANGLAGTAALSAGLWFFGVDGKMATYAALVGAIATSQWICARAWRA